MAADRPLVRLTVPELIRGLSEAPPGGGSREVEEIIHRFEPLLRHAWKQGAFEVEYGDFVQEVFTELFSGLSALRQPEAFPGYFRRVALSVAARLARKARQSVEALATSAPDFAALGADLFARAAVRSVLERLPERERAVIERLFLQGGSVADLAAELDLEPGSIRTSKSRALRRLRAILEADAALLEEAARRP